MSKLASWFRSAPSTSSSSSQTPSVAEETKDKKDEVLQQEKLATIADALDSVGFMMNDDMDGAISRLEKDDSVFHGLGLGMCIFMRSVLGFEKDVMTEASNKLYDVENRAWAELKKAQRKNESHSNVYQSGTEYSLVAAESQLLSAVVSVLHESLTEGIKGFYRLRKAYTALDAIVETENRVLGNSDPKKPALAKTITQDHMPGSFDDNEFSEFGAEEKRDDNYDGRGEVGKSSPPDDEESDLDFVDAKETPGASMPATPMEGLPSQRLPTAATTGSGRAGNVESTENGMEKLSLQVGASSKPPSDAALLTNPLDVFIHTGANMCFGMLLLMLSLVPPAMSKLLSIIGFRGDRTRGVRLLWNATRFRNINGAVSGLVLLGYYNGFMGIADILPPLESSPLSEELFAGVEDEEDERATVGVPRARCDALLAEMCDRYPDSGIWRFEEARSLAQDKQRLGDAIEILTTGEPPKMRQVAALSTFEATLNTMFAQKWDLCRKSALRCLELNDWSHGLYYYLAGCAEIERYRDAVHGVGGAACDRIEARNRKAKAEELLRKAPTVAGRKKFMNKPIPFDTYVQRKVSKLEERSKELKVDLADAVGSSLALEMVAFFGGAKRMNAAELKGVEDGMAWERCTASAEALEKMKKSPEETAIRAMAVAHSLRCQGRFQEARTLLNEEVLGQDPTQLKGGLKDDYILPSAHYELATIAWVEVCSATEDDMPEGEEAEATEKARKAKLRDYRLSKAAECQKYLDNLVNWESYLFDSRIGTKVQIGQATLKWFREKLGEV